MPGRLFLEGFRAYSPEILVLAKVVFPASASLPVDLQYPRLQE